MENKDYKYIKRKAGVISLIDIRLQYNRETGLEAPLDHGYFDDVEYICWLESKVVDLLSMKRKFIPWEPIKNK